MHKWLWSAMVGIVILLSVGTPVVAQDQPNPTAEALETQVAGAQATLTALAPTSTPTLTPTITPAVAASPLDVYRNIPDPITDPDWTFVGDGMADLTAIAMKSCNYDEQLHIATQVYVSGKSVDQVFESFATPLDAGGLTHPSGDYKDRLTAFDTQLLDALHRPGLEVPAWVPDHGPTLMQMDELLAGQGCHQWPEIIKETWPDAEIDPNW